MSNRSHLLLGVFLGLVLDTLLELAFGPMFPPVPVVKGYEEPSRMYQAPDGLWDPEPTLAE